MELGLHNCNGNRDLLGALEWKRRELGRDELGRGIRGGLGSKSNLAAGKPRRVAPQISLPLSLPLSPSWLLAFFLGPFVWSLASTRSSVSLPFSSLFWLVKKKKAEERERIREKGEKERERVIVSEREGDVSS